MQAIHLDRTLKAIGVVEASPTYDRLPGFERYAQPYAITSIGGIGVIPMQRLTLRWIDLRGT